MSGILSRIGSKNSALLQLKTRGFIHAKWHHSKQATGTTKQKTTEQSVDTFDVSMKKSNKSWNLGIKDSDFEKYTTLSQPVFDAFTRVDELYNEHFNTIFPESNSNNTGKRDYVKPGYNNDANPYNAWQLQGEIMATKPIEGSILKGKRIVLKDTINVAQWPMENGSKMFDNYICNMDATIVSRILENGGIIVGKSTNEDLCYSGGSHTSWPYAVKNPFNKDGHAGGSSSGTAVLVATQGKTGKIDADGGINDNDNDNDNDHVVHMGISGDQGGSIRIPACWCGVFGHKPTWGLVPYTGVAQISAHFDHVGPCATNMQDICDLLTSIAGKDGIDIRQLKAPEYQSNETNYQDIGSTVTSNNNDGIRIGILTEGFSAGNMDDSISTCIKDKLDKLSSSSGVKEIKNISIPMHNDMTAIWCAIGYESQYTSMYQYGTNGISPKNRADPMLNHIWKTSMNNNNSNINHLLSHTNKQNILLGDYLLNGSDKSSFGEYFCKGSLLAEIAVKVYENTMNEHNVDVLVCPTLPSLSTARPDVLYGIDGNFKANEADAIEMVSHALSMIANTAPFNVTGSPALTIPFEIDNKTGANGGKLFAGMQLIGRLWDDKTVLKAGHVIENALLK